MPKKENPAKLAVGKTAPKAQPAKVVKLRLPRNYEWTGDGYIIR